MSQAEEKKKNQRGVPDDPSKCDEQYLNLAFAKKEKNSVHHQTNKPQSQLWILLAFNDKRNSLFDAQSLVLL